MTCIVSYQLCVRPELDNHWALRDFAARLMANMVKSYNHPVYKLQARVLKVLTGVLHNEEAALSTLYGAIQGNYLLRIITVFSLYFVTVFLLVFFFFF